MMKFNNLLILHARIPAKAGIHESVFWGVMFSIIMIGRMDPRFRGDARFFWL